MAKILIADELRLCSVTGGKVFRMYADQNINLHLKEISKLAGIDKKINFHTGRHTFATIFLSRTKNISALKELMGHSNIRETMIYAHVLTDDLVEDMKCFDDFG